MNTAGQCPGRPRRFAAGPCLFSPGSFYPAQLRTGIVSLFLADLYPQHGNEVFKLRFGDACVHGDIHVRAELRAGVADVL